MKKNTKRILSLLLVLMMVVSLFPSAYAAETEDPFVDEGYGSSWEDWDDQPAEEVAPVEEEPFAEEPVEEPAPVEEPVEEPAPVEEPVEAEDPFIEDKPAVSSPANSFYFVGGNGLRVTVDAPEGAFPIDAEMVVTEVPLEEVQAKIDDSEFAGQTAVVATDISFYDGNGAELQPGVPVSVSISSDQIPAVEDPMVLHIADDGRIDAVGQLASRKAAMATASVQSVADEQAETLNVSFQASSFSTFTVTWGNNRATIHYVDTNGNELTVSNTVFPTNYGTGNNAPNYAYLIYDIEGYEYDHTYRGTDISSNQIRPILQKNSGGMFSSASWRYTTSTGQNATWNDLGNNNHIYVVYKEKTAPTTGGTPQVDQTETWPDEDTPPDKPTFSKASSHNEDGTNTIALSITAPEKEVEKSTPADVIVVFDVSGSMDTQDMSGSRLAAAQAAAKTMAGALLTGQNKDVRMALVSFSNSAEVVQDFTNNYTTFTDKIDDLDADGGTNWEKALYLANHLDVRQNAATFVVFITDGNPTFRMSRGNVSDSSIDIDTTYYRRYLCYGAGGSDNAGRNFSFAVDQVSAINGANKNFYAIGISNDVTKVQNLTTQGGVAADHAFIASNKQAMDNAFKSITESIKSYLGFGDVAINDGITDLTNTEMEVMQEIDPNSFTYYRYGGEGNKYGADFDHKTEWTTRAADKCGAATYDKSSGTVQWNMGNQFQLEDGVTYVVTFRAWASQDALNLVAELNNGTKVYAEGHDNSITPEQRAQVVEIAPPHDGQKGQYALKTNTNEVNATYKRTTKTGDTVTVNSTSPIEAVYQPGVIQNLTLDSLQMNITKTFEDDLTAGEDREPFVTLMLLRREGTQADKDSTTPLEPFSFPHTNKVPELDGQGKIIGWHDEFVNSPVIILSGQTDPKWSVSFYVAPGVKAGDEILEKGYDFSLAEPNIDYHYELIEEIINPMLVNDQPTWIGDYDGNTALTGMNRVKSGIDIKKVVKDVEGNVTTAVDDEFTIKGKLLDADGNPFTWQDGDNVNNSGAYHKFVPNPEGEFEFDGIKYERTIYKGHFASTANIEFTLKAGEFIRFINVPESCTFEFYEDDLPAGYDTDYVVDATTQHKTSPDGSFTPEGDVQPTVSDGKASLAAPGVVGNKQYSVTFTNQMTEPQVFYVYHSSNKMVEKIALSETDPRLTAEKDSAGTITGYTFNIANEVISGNIYGGYYKAYATDDAGIEEADAAVRGLTYTSADPGKGYTYATKTATTSNWATDPSRDAYTGVAANEGAWDGDLAYTESGLAMSPVVDTVYYLKEVPDMYLAPATYVVYDNNAGVFNSDKNATFYPVKQIHLISFTDDKNYKSVGFIVNANPKDLAPTTVPFWGTEITIQKMGTTTDTIDVTNRLYKDHIGAVVLQCADSMMQNNAYYREIPYQITLDGVKVTSIRQMTVLINDLTFNPPEGSNPGWIKPGMTKATVAKKPEVAVQ